MHSELKVRTKPRYLVLYFALAFGFSWAILVPEALAAAGLLGTQVPPTVLLLAGFGPAIAAFIAGALESGRQGPHSLLQRFAILRVSWVWYLVAALGPGLILMVGRGLEQVL